MTVTEESFFASMICEEIEYALYIYSSNEGTYEYSLEIETNK